MNRGERKIPHKPKIKPFFFKWKIHKGWQEWPDIELVNFSDEQATISLYVKSE